jgi:hypothetical protein
MLEGMGTTASDREEWETTVKAVNGSKRGGDWEERKSMMAMALLVGSWRERPWGANWEEATGFDDKRWIWRESIRLRCGRFVLIFYTPIFDYNTSIMEL